MVTKWLTLPKLLDFAGGPSAHNPPVYEERLRLAQIIHVKVGKQNMFLGIGSPELDIVQVPIELWYKRN